MFQPFRVGDVIYACDSIFLTLLQKALGSLRYRVANQLRFCDMRQSLDTRLVTSTYATSSSTPRSTPQTGSSVAAGLVCVQELLSQLLALFPSTARSGTPLCDTELCQVSLFNATFVLAPWPDDSAAVIQDISLNNVVLFSVAYKISPLVFCFCFIVLLIMCIFSGNEITTTGLPISKRVTLLPLE